VIAMKHALRKKFLHIRNNLDTTYQIQATEKIFKTLEESDIFKNSQKIFIYIGFGSEIQTEYLIKKYINFIYILKNHLRVSILTFFPIKPLI